MDEQKPPTWYSAKEIQQGIASGSFPRIPQDLIPAVTRHLQLAFNKGFQIGKGQVQSSDKELAK